MKTGVQNWLKLLDSGFSPRWRASAAGRRNDRKKYSQISYEFINLNIAINRHGDVLPSLYLMFIHLHPLFSKALSS